MMPPPQDSDVSLFYSTGEVRIGTSSSRAFRPGLRLLSARAKSTFRTKLEACTMSKFGEFVLRNLVRISSPPAAQRKRPGGDTYESYFQWQFDTSRALFGLYPNFDLGGKSVLEIGCGTGGRTAYLASTDAGRVVGIDINGEEIRLASDLCQKLKPELRAKITYCESNENDLLDIGQFDLVLLVDSMEHVVSPPAILRLAYQYTKPGGKCYFNTMGWYHPVGSHTGLLPWVNVVFSDETILNVIRWKISQPDYVPSRFDSSPPTERWRGVYNLRDRPGEHLNKITIGEIKRLVKYSIFARGAVTVLRFQRKHPAMPLLNLLRHVPVLQEMFHSGIVVEFERDPD